MALEKDHACPRQVRHGRSRGLLIAGVALLAASSAFAVFFHPRTAKSPAKPLPVAPSAQPGPIMVTLAAAPDPLGHTRLYGQDASGQAWSCRIDSSLVCPWSKLITSRLR